MGHVNWYLTQEETLVTNIVLKLSYDSLPRRLKPCFLYFGIFPEDFEVDARPLIQKWVAEGFIQQCGTRNPEDVAEDYLYELVDRSLVQVASRRSDGGVKTCRIHDLLRDLCLSEGVEDKFFEVFTGTNTVTQRMTKPRRLSIHCGVPLYDSSSNCDHSCTRSLFCFSDEQYEFTHKHWKWLVKGFKLARMLDFGQGYTYSISSKLEALIHLRYLRLSCSIIKMIPNSICNLGNLEALVLGSLRTFPPMCFVFPNGMWKLKRLRHIRTGKPLILSDFSGSNTKIMWNLQTLSYIVLNEAATTLIQKGMFPNIRKLGLFIKSANNKKWQRLWQGLERLTHLNTLKLLLSFELVASGVESIPFPAHITKLTLVNVSGMSTNIITSLANFTNLRILKLNGFCPNSYTFELKCFTGWSPQLQVFQMSCLNVRNWELANGAMPCLQRLVIMKCSDLHNLPNELWSLTTLRQVEVWWPSKELAQMLRNLEMKNGVELIIHM